MEPGSHGRCRTRAKSAAWLSANCDREQALFAVGTIVYEQTVLTNVHSNVTLNHGVIQLNPLTAQIYGGQESGSITVDTRPNPMTYAVNAKLPAWMPTSCCRRSRR